MAFEFDPDKSLLNQHKHGIDFIQAQILWDDFVIEVEINRKGKPRSVVIGMIGVKYWTAIITYRQTRIRIISVRRSRKEEVELYEENYD